MAAATGSLTPSTHIPIESTGLTPTFGGTPGFFSTEFRALNPFDTDFQNATASALRVEQPSTSLEPPTGPYASYQQDMPRSVTGTAMRRNYDPSLVPTPGPRVGVFRSSTLKESLCLEPPSSSRLLPSPRRSPEALDPAFLMEKKSAELPPLPRLPRAPHPGFGSSRGIHGQVTPPTDDSCSPDKKNLTKSTNKPLSQARKPRKRKFAEVGIADITIDPEATPSDYDSAPSTPQPKKRDDKNSSPTQSSKRRKFLERNRLAASKCRQKKKEWTNRLEEQARYQAQENKILRLSVAQLRDECLYLKNFLLSTHSGCQCVGVKNYLMKEAQLSQQVAAGIAVGGVMPIAAIIHPGYAPIMGIPAFQHRVDVTDRARSQSVGSIAMSDVGPRMSQPL